MRSLRSALLLLVLLAFGAQQWTVHAHWHAAAGSIDAQAGITAAMAADPAAPSPDPNQTHPDCVWCHAAAHAAAAAPPATWAGVPSLQAGFLFAAHFERIATFPAPSSWAWYSRGPPAA